MLHSHGVDSLTATSEHLAAIADLGQGAKRLVTLSIADRQRLLRDCLDGVQQTWENWIEQAWQAKRIPAADPARAEDIMTGPLPTVRYLTLLHQSLTDLAHGSRPRLPAAPYELRGRLRVPVFPTHSLFDRQLFRPIHAHVVMPAGVTEESMFGDCLRKATGCAGQEPAITLVLGAGNVSSIPITDALTKIFQQNEAVLLKMNPVNEYVGPIFEKAFAPLIDADLLRIAYGGADVGASLISNNSIDGVHITGSNRTHDAIVWGDTQQEQRDRKAAETPLLQKPITSELGNVSPWIVVPGQYSKQQLRFQAENIVASITSNASFVCVATKMVITHKDWPQREQFLDMVEGILSDTPRRFAYYPGARERYARFAKRTPDQHEYLPWTFRRDVDPRTDPRLFQEESFVCVCGETPLTANSPSDFLNRAVDFANQRMWGTLSAAMTVPLDFQTRFRDELGASIDRLKYGTVGINQWPGVAFALMSTSWGAYPGSALEDIQSGIGSVHNTYLLERPEKTVLSSPLTIFPKPMWFSTHRCPESVARSLQRLYLSPTVWRLPRILANAIRG